jgi:TolA-binding protein
VLQLLLGSGCVSSAQHQAKVEELERLRSESQRSEQQWLERIDRQSAKLGDLQQQLLQSDTRVIELGRSIQQVRDLSVQLDQRLTLLHGRPCTPESAAEPHSTEPSVAKRPVLRFESKAPRQP